MNADTATPTTPPTPAPVGGPQPLVPVPGATTPPDQQHHAPAEPNALLDGVKSPYRDIVLLNAAAAFVVAGRADTLKLGASLAAAEIDSGRAKATLDKLVSVSNS